MAEHNKKWAAENKTESSIICQPPHIFISPLPPTSPKFCIKIVFLSPHELTMVKYKKVTYYSTMRLSQPLPPMHAQEF